MLFDDNEIDIGEANKFITHGGGKTKYKKVKKDKSININNSNSNILSSYF